MGETKGRPKNLRRVHIIELTPKLDAQLDEALEIARLRTTIAPISATLGNPTAFPILAGFTGIFIAVLYLKLRFPDPAGQTRDTVEQAAGEIAKIIEESKAAEKGFELTQPLIDATRDFLLRLWEDPLFGFGGQGPFIPGEGVVP